GCSGEAQERRNRDPDEGSDREQSERHVATAQTVEPARDQGDHNPRAERHAERALALADAQVELPLQLVLAAPELRLVGSDQQRRRVALAEAVVAHLLVTV